MDIYKKYRSLAIIVLIVTVLISLFILCYIYPSYQIILLLIISMINSTGIPQINLK